MQSEFYNVVTANAQSQTLLTVPPAISVVVVTTDGKAAGEQGFPNESYSAHLDDDRKCLAVGPAPLKLDHCGCEDGLCALCRSTVDSYDMGHSASSSCASRMSSTPHPDDAGERSSEVPEFTEPGEGPVAETGFEMRDNSETVQQATKAVATLPMSGTDAHGGKGGLGSAASLSVPTFLYIPEANKQGARVFRELDSVTYEVVDPNGVAFRNSRCFDDRFAGKRGPAFGEIVEGVLSAGWLEVLVTLPDTELLASSTGSG